MNIEKFQKMQEDGNSHPIPIGFACKLVGGVQKSKIAAMGEQLHPTYKKGFTSDLHLSIDGFAEFVKLNSRLSR